MLLSLSQEKFQTTVHCIDYLNLGCKLDINMIFVGFDYNARYCNMSKMGRNYYPDKFGCPNSRCQNMVYLCQFRSQITPDGKKQFSIGGEG